jgi:hypothetical protein
MAREIKSELNAMAVLLHVNGGNKERQGRKILMNHDVNDLFRLLSVMEERQKNHQRDFEDFKDNFGEQQETISERLNSLEQTRTRWGTGAAVIFALGAAGDQLLRILTNLLSKQ